MLIARLDRIGLSYGTRQVLNEVSLSVDEREKIGLVGPNGAGKSSLFKVLAGIDPPQTGERTLRRGAQVAYLPQEYAGNGAATVLDEVVGGNTALAAIEAQIEQAQRQMGHPEILDDADRFDRLLRHHGELLDAYDKAGGSGLEGEARGLLRQLDIPEEHFDSPLDLLSGGQRKLVGLARCLVAKPDILLLDEPDNHLDLAGKARLEAIIRDFEGAVVIISHDRYLLDDTVSKIAELDMGRLTEYEGNYSSYAVQRELHLLKQQQDWVSQQKEIQRLEEAIARFKLWASLVVDERHIKQARNKQRQLDQMDKIERPVLERRKIALAFRSAARGGQKIVEARHLAKQYGDSLVLLDVDFTVWRGERVGIVGGNGAGKSVLFRLLLGIEPPTEGDVWVGPSIRLGYYAQGHETLDLAMTPIEHIRRRQPMREEEVVAFLGRFLFSYRQVSGPIDDLSGGEKSRLQLATLMLSGVNCLLLDEPTNHLDIESTEVLEAALDGYDGTVLAISHDRYFLDRVCGRILELEEGETHDFPGGGYSDYARQKERLVIRR